MKNFFANLLTVLLAAFALSASALPAGPVINNLDIINLQFTAQFQGGITDNGTLRVYAQPSSSKIVTKDILNQLARDEYAQTNYPVPVFPAGAQLAVNATNGNVVVVDDNNALLADVSDIVTFSSGTNDIVSGQVSDITGLAKPKTTELIYVRFNFDDTAITNGGNLSFFVTGLDTIKTIDSKPDADGRYTETASDLVQNTAGEGQSGGTPFAVTGTITGNRYAKLSLVPVVSAVR